MSGAEGVGCCPSVTIGVFVGVETGASGMLGVGVGVTVGEGVWVGVLVEVCVGVGVPRRLSGGQQSAELDGKYRANGSVPAVNEPMRLGIKPKK